MQQAVDLSGYGGPGQAMALIQLRTTAERFKEQLVSSFIDTGKMTQPQFRKMLDTGPSSIARDYERDWSVDQSAQEILDNLHAFTAKVRNLDDLGHSMYKKFSPLRRGRRKPNKEVLEGMDRFFQRLHSELADEFDDDDAMLLDRAIDDVETYTLQSFRDTPRRQMNDEEKDAIRTRHREIHSHEKVRLEQEAALEMVRARIPGAIPGVAVPQHPGVWTVAYSRGGHQEKAFVDLSRGIMAEIVD